MGCYISLLYAATGVSMKIVGHRLVASPPTV